jgi:hypothetical protein
MSTDPNDLGGAPGDEGTGATGTQPPGLEQRYAESEAKNAKLREENRKLHADALAATHGLTPTAAELLATVPLDKQAEYAEKLGTEFKGQTPAPTPTPAEGQPAPTTPEPAPPVAAPLAGADALAGMASGGTGPAPATPAPAEGDIETQLTAEFNEAASRQDWEGMKSAQDKMQRHALGQGRSLR